MTGEPPAAPRQHRDPHAAFRELYERTSPRISAYLRRVTGSPDWSEDLLQDTYVRYLNARRPEMDERQTVSYLFRIATNLVYDGWRSMRREREWEEVAPSVEMGPATRRPVSSPVECERLLMAEMTTIDAEHEPEAIKRTTDRHR